ncbi:hypothetical protein GCM10009550_39150 [Actinocorallia libanotica]|uniref:HTH tetR-type domain-containing protein n=1 Tax=Actinocorallia libanotica TaxID=46162 RepID=A0ABN1RCT2_9ACTN
MDSAELDRQREAVPDGTPSLGRPVGSKGEDTRRRILAATMQRVAEMGYARATIREIARAADMTSGSLYHYFPNKAEIVKATYLEVGAAAMPRLEAAAAQADGLIDKLVAVIDQGARIVQEYPYAVAFDRAVRAPGTDHAVAKISDGIFASLRDIVEDVIAQAHRNGELNPDATTAGAANAVFAIMRGLYDDAALATAYDFRDTVRALQLLLQGRLITAPSPPE